MLVTSPAALIAAYVREDEQTFNTIKNIMMVCVRRPYHPWDGRDDDQKDVDEEREGGWAYGRC